MDAEAWLPIVASVVLGQFALLGIDWLRGQMERNQRRADQRTDFQRATLLDLQDTLDELGRNAAAVAVLRQRAFALPGWRKDVPYTDPHAQAVLKAAVRMTTLAERIQDQHIRASVRDLDEALRAAMTADGKRTPAEAMERLRSLRRQANERIGEYLRAL